MALNSSGQISLGGTTVGQSINLQIGNTATTQVSFNDTTVRSLSQVTTTNTTEIMPTDFYNKGANVSYIGTTINNNGTATTATFTSAAIGTADTNRTVFVVVRQSNGGTYALQPTGVTIGGNAATSLLGTGASGASVSIWAYKLTTGTTANIVVTWTSGGTLSTSISVYRAVNVTTLAANASSTYITNKTATLNVTSTASGFVIGAGSDDNSTGATWSGLTIDYNGTNGTNGTSSWATSASGYFTGSGLKSISSTFTGGGGTIATFIALYIV